MISLQTRLTSNLKAIPSEEKLGFGKYFTDHMFVARYVEGQGWSDARVEPYGPLPLDPAAAVLHYGQCLFEGLKAYRSSQGEITLFRPEFNYHRLCAGAERLCLVPPSPEIYFSGLKALIEADARWVPKGENTALYVRPTLIGSEGFLGVRPSREILFFIILSPVGSYYGTGGIDQGVKIWVEEKYVRAAPGGMGEVKAGANYAASLKSSDEARKAGFAQVLWLDVNHEFVEEVGTMNVFFVFKNEIVTPSLDGTILPGCTRAAALELLRAKGLPVVERKLKISEVIEKARSGELLEAFGTGTAAVISPIGELHYRDTNHKLGDGNIGQISRQLRDEMTGIQRGRRQDPFGWMVPVRDLERHSQLT